MNVVYVSFITRTIYSHSLGLDPNQLQEHVSLFSKTQQCLFTGTLACFVRLPKSLIFFPFFCEEGRRTKLRVPGLEPKTFRLKTKVLVTYVENVPWEEDGR